jgi:penicillin-binding protein 1A
MSFVARALRLVLRVVLVVGVLATVAGAGGAYLVYREVVRGLPDLRKLEDFRPALSSRVFDRSGRPIGEFFEERRRLTPVGEMPRHVVLAFVAGEDDAFFQHTGLDYRSILRAAYVNLRAGGKVKQGGSTITQQVAKSLLSSERSIWRKLKDMVLARRIEQRFTKDEILYLYLNLIYLGHGAYGVGDAALTYFGKPLQQIGSGEAALLAGLPKAPTDYSPYNDPEGAEQRRQYVLRRMAEERFITQEEWEIAARERPLLRPPPERDDYVLAGYFTEEVRRFLYDRLGSDTVLRGGLVVETTLDLDRQRAAVVSLRRGLEALESRHGGWRGALRKAKPEEFARTVAELGRENGFPPLTVNAERRLVPLHGYAGVVMAVDAKAGTLRVAFGPGAERELTLADVSAALPRADQKSTDPKLVAKALAVGDVARFELRPVATAPSEKAPDAEHDPESDGDEAAAAAADGAAPEAPPAPEMRLVLVQAPRVEGALVSMETATGEVVALAGGYDFERSEFDRVTQARRQPGSAFKPFVYGAALERGYTPNRTVVDSPVEIWDVGSQQWWRPENYTKKFLGAMTAREALARSVNNATIRVFLDVGVDPVIDYARRVGIRSPLGRHLSLSLGSTEVTLLELTGGYATIAAGGMRVEPRFIRRVLDRDGQVLLENVPLQDVSARDAAANAKPAVSAPAAPPPPKPSVWEIPDVDGVVRKAVATAAPEDPNRGVTPENAFLMTHLLRAVVDETYGTAHKAAVLGRPLAGKTGTTNDQKDAWFVGYSPELVAGVWVGHDEKHVLGDKETGGRAALPIWMDYMGSALAQLPVQDFPVPAGVVFVRRGSGFQPFAEGTEPGSGGGGGGGDSGEMDSYDLLRNDAF